MPSPEPTGLAVLAADDPWRLVHVAAMPAGIRPRALALDRSGRYLLLAGGRALLVLDARALAEGAEDPIVALESTESEEAVGLALTPDERLAFLAEEDQSCVSVFDLDGSLQAGRPRVSPSGRIAVPSGPTGIAASPDGRYVFVTSQDRGVLSVIDVPLALSRPAEAVVAAADAGAQPVRVAVSPSGENVWVTARGSDLLLGFDVESLIGKAPSRVAEVRVGKAPVGVATVPACGLVVVANSNRYEGGDDPQTISVVDAAAALAGRRTVLGVLPAGAFPRDVAGHPDGRTVLVTNFRSRTLETVSLRALG
jgi:DNA-binding beta-propeller fold protein YncE